MLESVQPLTADAEPRPGVRRFSSLPTGAARGPPRQAEVCGDDWIEAPVRACGDDPLGFHTYTHDGVTVWSDQYLDLSDGSRPRCLIQHDLNWVRPVANTCLSFMWSSQHIPPDCGSWPVFPSLARMALGSAMHVTLEAVRRWRLMPVSDSGFMGCRPRLHSPHAFTFSRVGSEPREVAIAGAVGHYGCVSAGGASRVGRGLPFSSPQFALAGSSSP